MQYLTHAVALSSTWKVPHPARFGLAKDTMQLFMWQRDNIRVAHHITDCYERCRVPLMMLLIMRQPSSSSALAAG